MRSPEECAREHKTAFRKAFDYLNDHFPPEDGGEWWDDAALDLSAAFDDGGRGVLLRELLAGVYKYLEEEWKRRREDATGSQ